MELAQDRFVISCVEPSGSRTVTEDHALTINLLKDTEHWKNSAQKTSFMTSKYDDHK
jgi:hypothetical protein